MSIFGVNYLLFYPVRNNAMQEFLMGFKKGPSLFLSGKVFVLNRTNNTSNKVQFSGDRAGSSPLFRLILSVNKRHGLQLSINKC